MMSAVETMITGRINPCDILHQIIAASAPIKQTQSFHSGFVFLQKSAYKARAVLFNAVIPVAAAPHMAPLSICA